jgi:hypothetical protein
MAGQIPAAKYVELPGVDHVAWIGEVDILLVHGPVRRRRWLYRRAAALGDARWRGLIDRGSRLSQRVSNYD